MKPDTQPGVQIDAIDRILSSNEELIPSSGFLTGVMDRVREEAIAPQPIPFPWKLALPGIVLVAGTIGWLIYDFIRMMLDGTVSGNWTSSIAMPDIPAAEQQVLNSVLWTALALVISLVSWAFTKHLTRRSNLL